MMDVPDLPILFNSHRIETAQWGTLARTELVRLYQSGQVELDGLEPEDEALHPEGVPRFKVHHEARVGQTSLSIRWSKVNDPIISTFVGVITEHLSSSPQVAVTVAVARDLWARVRLMTDEEVEIICIMQRVTRNKHYKEWIEQDKLLAAIPADRGDKKVRELLATMVKRKLVQESAGLWKAVF